MCDLVHLWLAVLVAAFSVRLGIHGLSCETPERPENGLVSVISEGEGAPQAVYGCRVGYLLKGGGVRGCHGGNWSGIEPTCEFIADAVLGSLQWLSSATMALLVVVCCVAAGVSIVALGLGVILWKFRRTHRGDYFEEPMQLMQYRKAGAEYTVEPGSIYSLDMVGTTDSRYQQPIHVQTQSSTGAQPVDAGENLDPESLGTVPSTHDKPAIHPLNNIILVQPLRRMSNKPKRKTSRSASVSLKPVKPPKLKPRSASKSEGQREQRERKATRGHVTPRLTRLKIETEVKDQDSANQPDENYSRPLIPLGTEDLLACADNLIRKSMMSLDDIGLQDPSAESDGPQDTTGKEDHVGLQNPTEREEGQEREDRVVESAGVGGTIEAEEIPVEGPNDGSRSSCASIEDPPIPHHSPFLHQEGEMAAREITPPIILAQFCPQNESDAEISPVMTDASSYLLYLPPGPSIEQHFVCEEGQTLGPELGSEGAAPPKEGGLDEVELQCRERSPAVDKQLTSEYSVL